MTAPVDAWKKLLAAILTSVLIATPAVAQDLQASKKALRLDAIRIMGAALKVPSAAAYCEKNVEDNSSLMDAAKAWNERHHELLVKVLRTIEWSGGMSATERALYDRLGYQLLRSEFNEAPNKPTYCRQLLAEIISGDIDLEKSPVTTDAVRHIMAATLNN